MDEDRNTDSSTRRDAIAVDEDFARRSMQRESIRHVMVDITDRAAQVALGQYLRMVSSWPFRDETRVPGHFAADPASGVDQSDVDALADALDRRMNDWCLIVSDGDRSGSKIVRAQGRAALEATGDLTIDSGYDEIYGALGHKIAPPGPGLWIYRGHFYITPGAEGYEPVFEGEFRPAKPFDLKIMNVSPYDWMHSFDEHDAEQVRAIVLAMHAPGCSQYHEAESFRLPDGAAAIGDHAEAIDGARAYLEDGEPCGCTQFADHQSFDKLLAAFNAGEQP